MLSIIVVYIFCSFRIISNKWLNKIPYNNTYEEEIDQKHWLKKIISKSFIFSIGYFDFAYLGISCQNISKDFGYLFIGK